MNNKPMIIANDDLSEGVYATGSGGAGGIGVDCWWGEITTTKFLDGPGSDGNKYNWYEVHLHHKNEMGHASNGCQVKFTFSAPVSVAYCENREQYTVNIQGSDVIVSRNLHANGDFSGDHASYKLFAHASNEANTLALGVPSITILKCDKKATPNTGADT